METLIVFISAIISLNTPNPDNIKKESEQDRTSNEMNIGTPSDTSSSLRNGGTGGWDYN